MLTMSSVCKEIEVLSTALSLNYTANKDTANYNEDTVIPNCHKYFLMAYWVTSPQHSNAAWLQLATDVPPAALKGFKQRCSQAQVPADCMRDKEGLVRDYKLASRPTKEDKKDNMSKLHYTFPSAAVCDEGLAQWKEHWSLQDANAAQQEEEKEFGNEEAEDEDMEADFEGSAPTSPMPMGVDIGELSEAEQASSPTLSAAQVSDFEGSDNEEYDVDYEFSGDEPEGDEASSDEREAASPSSKRARCDRSPTKQGLSRGEHSLENLIEGAESEIASDEEREEAATELDFEGEEADSVADKVEEMQLDPQPEGEQPEGEQPEGEQPEGEQRGEGEQPIKKEKRRTEKDYEDFFFEARAEPLQWHPVAWGCHALPRAVQGRCSEGGRCGQPKGHRGCALAWCTVH